MRPLTCLFVLSAFCGGCGGDVVAHSAPVSLELGTIESDDIDNGAFAEDKNINTDSGNPYAAFLKAAKDALGGADPSAIEVERVTLNVGGDSKGIGSEGLATVMENVEVFFSKDGATVVVARAQSIPSNSTLDVDVHTSAADLEPLRPNLLSGDFKAGVRGDAKENIASEVELRLEGILEFNAIE